jgi:hypothetical protein
LKKAFAAPDLSGITTKTSSAVREWLAYLSKDKSS